MIDFWNFLSYNTKYKFVIVYYIGLLIYVYFEVRVYNMILIKTKNPVYEFHL